MDRERRQKILDLAVAKGALKFGEFVLSSGQRSSYYFDGRILTLDPEAAPLIAQEMSGVVREWEAQAIGGPTLGADPIVAATVVVSSQAGYPVSGFLVRKERKEHGAQKLIEGTLRSGMRVTIVDDVCTTGGNLFWAIEAAEAEGCQVVAVGVILDRRQGGSDELRKRGYPFFSLLEATSEGEIAVSGS